MWKYVGIFVFATLVASQDSVKISEPAEVEYAQSGPAVFGELEVGVPVGGEVIDVGAPKVELTNPAVRLGKETPEVIDIPHVPLNLPGNVIENQDLTINVPSPIIEAPKPIIEEKATIFRVPQPIIQVPKPIIEHVPVYYRVPHGVRYPNQYIETQPYLAQGKPVGLVGSAVPYPALAAKDLSMKEVAPANKPFTKSISFTMNFPMSPTSGKTIVKHFTIGK